MIASFITRVKTSQPPRLPAYYVSIAIDIILLYVINNLIYMNIPALHNGRLVSCLWAINLALTVGILGNFILLLYRKLWTYHFVQMLVDALTVLTLFVIFRWFPFNLDSAHSQDIVKIVLIVVMVGMGILALVEYFLFIAAFVLREKPPIPAPLPGLLEAPAVNTPESLLTTEPPVSPPTPEFTSTGIESPGSALTGVSSTAPEVVTGTSQASEKPVPPENESPASNSDQSAKPE
jgi:hypothetical protein